MTTTEFRLGSPAGLVCIALMAFYAACMLVAAVRPELATAIYFFLIGSLTLFGLIHGSFRYGAVNMLVFMALMLASVIGFEAISIRTGVPFGNFHHTAAMGPQVLSVPWLAGFAYFSAGYVAWTLANLLLGEPDRHAGILPKVALAVTAAFFVTAWDACIDPIGGTVARAWVWEDGGGYFGVPLSNFVGWLITSYVAFQVFALLTGKNSGSASTAVQSSAWWALPAIQFLVMGLQYPLNLVMLPDVEVIDPAGVAWRTGHIFEGTTVVALFTVILISLTALFRIGIHSPGDSSR